VTFVVKVFSVFFVPSAVNNFFFRDLAPWNTGLGFHRASDLLGKKLFSPNSVSSAPLR
jgi:hypothetical protein